MPRSFKTWIPRGPSSLIRLGVGVLLGANLVAAYFVLRPPGGSPQQLREQVEEVRTRIRQQQGDLERTRLLAGKIESGRSEGDGFMSRYFLPRRTAYSTIMAELNDIAGQAKIVPRESAFGIEPVEGSDILEMMQISANYEGTYVDLIHFVNLLDKSDRLMLIEGLNATPQQAAGRISVTLKLDTFVREDGSAQ